MSYAEEYRLVWANLIVNEYEKAAMKEACHNGVRDAAMVQWLKSMTAIEMALSSADSVLKGQGPEGSGFGTAVMGLTSSGSDSEENSNTGNPRPPAGDLWTDSSGELPGFADACAEEGGIGAVFDFDEDTEFQGLMAGSPDVSLDFEYNAAKALDKALADMGLPLANPGDGGESYLENCWSCLLNFDFNWQLPAVNLTAEIDALLKQLEDLLDWMLERSKKSYDFLKDLICDLSWLWKFICLPDLIALMAMLKGLLMKYMMDSFALSLDWTGIVGPIIKAIVDALAMMIEQIVALIMVPIDCIIGMVQTIDAFGQGLSQTATVAGGFWDHINGGVFAGGLGSSSSAAGQSKTFKIESGTENSQKWPGAFGEAFDFKYGSDNEKSDKAQRAPNVESTAMGPKTSWNLNINSGLSEEVEQGAFKQSSWNWASTTVAALQELKNWIREISQQIIFAIKSLGLLFSGQLKLSVMKSGLIMLIIDMIAFFRALYDWITKGWDDFCNKDAAEDLANILTALSHSDEKYNIIEEEGDDESEARYYLKINSDIDRIDISIPLNECALGNTKDPMYEAVFKTIEENTEYRRDKWGL